MADETTGAQRLTLADMAKEMRQRASFADLNTSTRDLLQAWADALEREYTDMTTEYERLCRDYDMAMEALKQDEHLLKQRPAQTAPLRPVVQWFAEHMERELRANDHKPGWQNDSPTSLLVRAYDELSELSAACLNSGDVERIVSEAADLANFAMMLADIARLRQKTSRVAD